MSISSEQMEDIIDYAIGFLPEYPAPVPDWEHLLYRIENAFDLDLGDSMLSPDIVAIQRAIRKARKEGG